MKAWQLSKYGSPLSLLEVADPVAGPGEVVVDVRAAGLCHSDVTEVQGDIEQLNPPLPFILGHEVAGVVLEVGEGVDASWIGKRVACVGTMDGPGIGRDGGFAERCATRAANLIALPDSLDIIYAAPATDAGMTALHALRVGGVENGTRVGLIGIGGLGSYAAQLAVALGADVYAAEIKEEVWPQALEWGVRKCAKDISEFKDHDLQVIVDYAGVGTTTTAAIQTLGHGGRAVQVGAGKMEATIPMFPLIVNEVALIGSAGGTQQDCRDVLAYTGEGKINPVVTPIAFEEIGEGLDRLERGEVRGRLVAVRNPETA